MFAKHRRHQLSVAFASLLLVFASAETWAQTDPYPGKAVKIIADSAAGSTPDVILRIVADRLGQI